MRLVAALLLLPGAALAATNNLTLSLPSGVSSQTDYPLRFARVFAQGEIADCPQLLVGGTPVTTQANVKSTWSDGSAKHVIVSAVVPSISGTTTLTFQNQASCNTTELTEAQMLDAAYDFEATIELTSGTTETASARTMLDAADYTVWAAGTVAQTVVIADHSATRAYDLGWDAYKSFRPIFEVTFWPALSKYYVRYIGENVNTETLQDLTYDVDLTIGQASPTTWYTKAGFTHCAPTTWTRTQWSGTQPDELNLDHNLAYLAETKAVYNYDPTQALSESTIASVYSYFWSGAATDLGDVGNLTKTMGAAAGRPEIGPMPSWHTRWLYTGDRRMREMALKNTELSGGHPGFFREGDSGKANLGHSISHATRPTFVFAHQTSWATGDAADTITPVGAAASNPKATTAGWTFDVSHMPESHYLPYLLTGEHYYLEQGTGWVMLASASGEVATANGRGRGPALTDGNIMIGQIRGDAWSLRSRANWIFLMPDGWSEKATLTDWMKDTIAIWDGGYNDTTSDYYTEKSAEWAWGNTYRPGTVWSGNYYTLSGVWPVEGQWARGSGGFCQPDINFYGIDTEVTDDCVSQFEMNFMLIALGRAVELGWPMEAIRDRLGQWYVSGLTEPSYNKYLMGSGRAPTIALADPSNYITDWSVMKSMYVSSWQTLSDWPTYVINDAEHGYAYAMMAGVSYLGNATAWAEVSGILDRSELDTWSGDNTADPKFAIVPRATTPTRGMAVGTGTRSLGQGTRSLALQ